MIRTVRVGAVLCCLALAARAQAATVIEDNFSQGTALQREDATQAPPVPSSTNLGPQRMLVIMVDFPNAPANVTPAAYAAEYNATVKPYFEKVSYNRAGPVTYTVLNTIHLTQLSTNCQFPPTEAINAADPQVNYNNYDFVSVVGPFSCPWGGLGYVGRVNFTTQDGTVLLGINNTSSGSGSSNPHILAGINIHELGHNFGVHHAGFLNCGADALTAGKQGCSVDEYGDPFSVMGSYVYSNAIGYFEPSQRIVLGWLDLATEILDNPANGTYQLIAHEFLTTGSQYKKAMRFPRPNGDYLWVTLRAPLDFDDNFSTALPGTNIYNGLLLHVQDTGGPYKPTILDNKAPRPDNIVVALEPGQEFVDPDTGIGVKAGNRGCYSLCQDVTITHYCP
jgi:Metallo-peptidase family M12B Reprolysin-like